MPTPAGWKLLAFGVVAVLAGRATATSELYVIGTTALSVVVIAVAVRTVHPSRLSIGRGVSSAMVAVSEQIEVTLRVQNEARFASPTVRVNERVTGGAGMRFILAPLPGSSAATGSYRLRPARRGVLEIGPTVVDDIDGLGLAHRRLVLDRRTRVIVHPPIEALAAPRLPVGGDLSLPREFRNRLLGLESDEFDVLRPYVEGDDLRHVHWRSTARRDAMMVRRFQPSRPGCLTVVIDTRPPGDITAVQDRTTSVAASLASAVLRSGDETRILTTDGRGTAVLARRSEISAALEFLALLEGGSPAIDIEVVESGSVVVAVSASPEVIDEDGVRIALARRLRASLIITYGSGHRRGVEPGADIEGGWIHLTGPGQLPALWRAQAMARGGTPTFA